jgi:hypothetical protein
MAPDVEELLHAAIIPCGLLPSYPRALCPKGPSDSILCRAIASLSHGLPVAAVT